MKICNISTFLVIYRAVLLEIEEFRIQKQEMTIETNV